MKLLVCCLIIIANVSNNGKASIENIVPSNTNILLPDTTKSSDKSCYRPCKFNVKPRRCQYNFKIEPTLEDDGRPAIVVNGMTPGPSIHVCLNDIVVVKVHNKVPGQDLTLHWHGIDQKGTPYMDGVPMVTQCPIGFGSIFQYAFVASSPGTLFYHADSVNHHSDGVYGSLIVDQPQPLEPHASLYDFDKSKENTLTIGARFSALLTGNSVKNMKPDSLVINGKGKSSKIFVIPGYHYRLRLINAIAVQCPLIIDIDQHSVIAIASDGKPVKPVSTNSVLLYPGERMDVIVEAAREGGGYWLNVRGFDACEGLSCHGMLIYSGFNYTSLLEQDPTLSSAVVTNIESVLHGQKMLSLRDQSPVKDVKTTYLGIDRNVIAFKDADNDYRYLSDVVPKKNYYPAALSIQDIGVVQINNKNFLYPNEMYLLKSRFGSNDSYSFHMHGYSVEVVATGKTADGKPISKKEFQILDRKGGIERNLRNPPLKDTFVVPNKGYTIVRLKPDRGGSWMLECRACSSFSLPVAILIDVPLSIPKAVVQALPKCGSYKPADVLLN
ncbi:unnamed protein product, partial [Iphiclides podalirius]